MIPGTNSFPVGGLPSSEVTPVHKKSIGRRVSDAFKAVVHKIAEIASKIFNALFRCFRSKVDKKLTDDFIFLQAKEDAAKKAHLNMTKVPLTSQKSTIEPGKDDAVEESPPPSKPLKGKAFNPIDKAPSHIAARELVGDVVDELIDVIMVKHVVPQIPKINKGAAELQKGMVSLSEWSVALKDHFDILISNSTPIKSTKDEKADPFLLLFDVLDTVVLSHWISNPGAEDLDLGKIITTYIYGSEAVETNSKPKLDWLPEKSHKYIMPTIEWIVESYAKREVISFDEFMMSPERTHGITKEQYLNEKPEIRNESLGIICKKIFDPLHASLQNTRALNDLIEPVKLEKTIRELVHENTHMVAGMVTDHIFAIASKLEFTQLLQNTLPILTQRLEGKISPLEKEDAQATAQANALIDLIFPIVIDENGKEVRTLAIMWDSLHIPEGIEAALDTLPTMESTVKHWAGLKAETSLPPKIRIILTNMKSRAVMRAAKAVQTQINISTATMLKKVIDKVSDPFYLNETLANDILPKAIEKILVVVIQEVLSKQLNKGFPLDFKKILDAMNPQEEKNIKGLITARWFQFVQNPKTGLNTLLAMQDSLFEGVSFKEKFNSLVSPTIDGIVTYLQQKRAENPGVVLEENAIQAHIKDYLIELNKFKQVPLKGDTAPLQHQLVDMIKLVLKEGEFLQNKMFGGFLVKQASAKLDPVGELIVKAMPSLEEILVLAVDSLRKEWTTTSTDANGVTTQKIDLKKIMPDDVPLTQAQQLAQENAIKAKLDARFTQVSTLASDFVGIITSGIGYFGIVSAAAKSFLGPDSLKGPITLLHTKLLADKQKNKELIYPIFKNVINQLQEANKQVAIYSIKDKVFKKVDD